MLEVAEAIGSDLVLEEIDRTHRLGRPKGSQGVVRVRDIIIKFTSYRSRQKMMRNKAKLKQTDYLRAVLNEGLTAPTALLDSNIYGAINVKHQYFLLVPLTSRYVT